MDKRKDCGRDERIVYTSQMDSVSSIYNPLWHYASSQSRRIVHWWRWQLWLSLTADEGINRLCRRVSSFVDYSAVRVFLFRIEGFWVSFFYYNTTVGVYTLTVVYIGFFSSPPASPTPALRLTVRSAGQLTVWRCAERTLSTKSGDCIGVGL